MTMDQSPRMTARERSDLVSLIRRRERVQTTEAKERAAALKAEAAHELTKMYEVKDAESKRLIDAAQALVNELNGRIQAEAEASGRPRELWPVPATVDAPRYAMTRDRRADLLSLADSRIDAQLKAETSRIQRAALAATEAVMRDGLGVEALAVLDSLPDEQVLVGVTAGDLLNAQREALPGVTQVRRLTTVDDALRALDDE
ncbi:MAG: hypothetical protein QM677_02535 [Microbacterium sp.]